MAKEKFVYLTWSDGISFPFQALVVGAWCVHEVPLFSSSGYRVSHVATGLGLLHMADGLSRRDAMDIAKLLSERLPGKLAGDDRYIIEAAVAEVLGR